MISGWVMTSASFFWEFFFQEKYGPKGQNKVSNGTTPKSNKDSKQKPEVDINVGLSEQPPWFCRYVFFSLIYLFFWLLMVSIIMLKNTEVFTCKLHLCEWAYVKAASDSSEMHSLGLLSN